MTLHAAIVQLLQVTQQPMTIREIADHLNFHHWYVKADGSKITAFQIGRRIKGHPELFSLDHSVVHLLKENGVIQVGGSHYQKKVRERNKKAVRDEQYVLDICDQVLGVISKRGHRFDFLLGDKNKQGKAAKLPVDAYYERLGLVIEYRERQHTEAVFHFDKPDRVTVSGMGRAAQRKRYDQFRREVLPAQGLSLIEIDYSHFLHNSSKRIKRDKSRDTEIIRQRLWSFIPK